MSGCDSEALSRLIDGEVAPKEAARLRAHIESCPVCSAAFEGLQELDTLCKEAMPKTEFRRPALPERRRWRLAALAAAALVLVTGGLTLAALRETLWAPPSATTPLVQDTTATASGAGPAMHEEVKTAPVTTPGEAQPGVTGAVGGERGRVFRGTVVNVDGEPVAGANVSAMGHNAPSTVTSASGAFELPWNADCTGIRIDGPGYTPQYVNLEEAPLNLDVTAHVLLLKAETATGKVVDAAGQPLEGVWVRSTDGSAATHTAADGSFTLQTQSAVALSRPDFPETVYSVDDLSSTFVLSRGGAVRVRVVKDRAPAPGIRVSLGGGIGDESGETTDAEGVAVFENVAPGPFSLRAGDNLDCSVAGVLTVEAGKTAECTLTVLESRAGTARGKVFDADGAPVPNADVCVYSVDNPTVRRTVATGADGGFELTLWPGRNEVMPQWWDLRGRYPGCRPAEPRMLSVMPDPSRAAYAEFRLERDSPGRVAMQNERGEPLETALVRWESGFRCAPSGELSITVDQGEFEVSSRVKLIQAYDPAADRLGAVTVEPRRLVRFRCDKPAARLHGRVVDRDGDPVPYALVEAYLREEHDEMPWAPRRCTTQSARDGRFTVGPLAAGASYSVSVYGRGYAHPEHDTQSRVSVSDAMPEMNIVLWPRDAVVEGRVVNADGSPATNVRLQINSGDYGFATSLPAGFFSLNLLPRDYTLIASTKRFGGGDAQSEPVVVTAPAKAVVLRIPDAGVGQTPQGPEYEVAEDSLKQMGIVFRMFGAEHDGVYPELSQTPGVFTPDLSVLYPEYLADDTIVQWIAGRQNGKVVYLGYAANGAEAGMAVLDAYQQYGPEGLAGQDIALPEDAAEGPDHVFRLREGIERFFITDINDPSAGARAQSTIPLMWEMPGAHPESGGFVLFMDGHTEWREYPGEFPMTPEFIERLNGLMAPR